MKNHKPWKNQKEFDTKTLLDDIQKNDENEEDKSERTGSPAKKTRIYEPRPLTPDDDIYEDILEQFANAPTKPKYWFEEFGKYWSCSCGHINKGSACTNCGLDKELLRSLFILHKPADVPGKLDKRLRGAKKQVDQEDAQAEKQRQRRQKLQAMQGDNPHVVPVEEEMTETAISKDTTKAANTAMTNPSSEVPIPSAQAPKHLSFKKKMLILIAILLILAAAGGAAVYKYFAAPAMQYEDAIELQKSGKYEKAIAKFETLDDYKDCDEHIWECYISIGDDYYDDGKYEEAIETYDTAAKLKESNQIESKIRKCYIGIGNRYYDNKKYEKAIDSYQTAMEIQDTDVLQEKINKCKFAYVEANKSQRSKQVETYLAELMAIKYAGIQEIYDDYYAWHVKIIANTTEDDYKNDVKTISRHDTAYFHVTLSGGEPSEKIEVYYEVSWPNGSKQVSNLNTKYKSGSKITARFQYPIPVLGREGKLTFTLYDKSTNEVLGSDAVTFKN